MRFTGSARAAARSEPGTWPTISFVLQGDAGDVKLDVPPGNYWQVNAPSRPVMRCRDHARGKRGWRSWDCR